MYQKQYLIKKIKKHGIISAIFIAVTAAIFGAASYFSTDFSEQAQRQKNEYSRLTQTIEDSRNKSKFVREVKPVYENLKLVDGKETIDRITAANTFDELRRNYAISELKVDLGPISEETADSFKRLNAIAVSSELSIQMNIFSDVTLYNFMKKMESSLSGAVRYRELIFEFDRRSKNIEELLSSPSVRTSFRLNWYGIKSLKKPENGMQQQPGGIVP